jgi:L-2-hydroxyglutarate oxidase LhgO
VEQLDAVVIGAGVVGLAVGRALALAGREVLVLEAAGAFGTGISSRSSEVIHAGIYYPPGSLKAQLCVRGRRLLYDYCADRAVPHRRTGKLIVATQPDQLGTLGVIAARAAANGVDDLSLLDADEARALEPALHCLGALHVPSTGIVDSHALMLALLADLEHLGGLLVTNSEVITVDAGVNRSGDAIVFELSDGTRMAARTLVNAAGLHALALARRTRTPRTPSLPHAAFAKGHYFSLPRRAPFERLVYPVPVAGGLGVHLTLDLAGHARFGPDVEWIAAAPDGGPPADPTLYTVDPARADAFEAEVRAYWPDLPRGALQPAYAGVRPKISAPEAPAADFLLLGPAQHGARGLVHLLGIESPGLTSCLALAERAVELLR